MQTKSKRRGSRLLKRQGASYYLNLFRLSKSKVGDDAEGNQINEA